MDDNKLNNGFKEEKTKGKCELEVLELIFCMNKKYECYGRMKNLDLCLEKNKLEDYMKSKVDDSQ
tara:strand:+ start:124 stop:318 length:195 start_codon:yes stop_codon:yes gene_type:complete